MMDAKILRKSITRKDLRPTQSLTGVFPSRSTPTSCNTLLRTGCTHAHTGQAHAVGHRNVIRGQPPRVKGILVLEQHRSICKGQSRRNFPQEVRIDGAINNPADIDLGGVDRFLVSAAQLQ